MAQTSVIRLGGQTRTMIAASLENDVFPKLGERVIDGLRLGDIRALVQSIEARGAGETATRVLQRLRAIFRYAIAHELLETDPTHLPPQAVRDIQAAQDHTPSDIAGRRA